MAMQITYYGSRGSLPVSGKPYNKYGGSTTCVCVKINGQVFILDSGTGIRQLGLDLMKEAAGKPIRNVHILFTHTHWDHIQGFPFFIPALLPKNKIEIYGETKREEYLNFENKKVIENWTIEKTLFNQQNFMYFPITTRQMAATLGFHELSTGQNLEFDKVKISTLKVPHPNSTLAYRFQYKKFVYIFCTDIEHNDAIFPVLGKFCAGADILAYDCQYTPDEYTSRVGWGHSTYEIGAKLCREYHIKQLHMIHHDPTHDDKFIDKMETAAKKIFAKTTAVREGLSVEIK